MFIRNQSGAANSVQIIIAILLTSIAVAYPVYLLSRGLLMRFQMMGREM